MKKGLLFLLIIIIIAVVISAGCTSQNTAAPTAPVDEFSDMVGKYTAGESASIQIYPGGFYEIKIDDHKFDGRLVYIGTNTAKKDNLYYTLVDNVLIMTNINTDDQWRYYKTD